MWERRHSSFRRDRTRGLEDAPELGVTKDFVSVPTTPLPEFGRGIPHQLCAVSRMT